MNSLFSENKLFKNKRKRDQFQGNGVTASILAPFQGRRKPGYIKHYI